MTRYRILPYRQGSKSAKALAEALGGKVLKLEGSTFKPKETDVVINWGNINVNESSYPLLYEMSYEFYNWPHVIHSVSNKLNFFKLMAETNPDLIPRFWTQKEDIPDDAYPIVCRTVLAGHSGAGIVIADTPEDLVAAPLYVQYMKKKDEYRVHVGTTGIIAVQRKARRESFENPNWQVRNHANGFVFVRGGFNPPPSVCEAAQKSLQATGLDFGAVDVVWNEHQQRPYVLEINTAPGLEGQTIIDYTNYFKGLQS